MNDDAFEVLESALRKAFIALTEGEGYLRGLSHSASDLGKQAHARACSNFVLARAEIEQALLFRRTPPMVHQQRASQTKLFDDSEL